MSALTPPPPGPRVVVAGMLVAFVVGYACPWFLVTNR